MVETPTTASAAPFDNAAAMQEANTRLLRALNEQLGGRQGVEDRYAALRVIRPQVVTFLERGIATGARLEEQHERTAAQVQVDYWASLLEHAGVPTSVERIVEFDAERLPTLDERDFPFAGLQAIDSGERLIGRERAVASLVERIAGTQLVVVQGNSGSGKSSLVSSGAVPVWLGRAQPRPRLVGPLQPGKDVLRALASALLSAAEPARRNTEAGAEAEQLRHDPEHLVALAGGLESAPLLLVIDSFQQVFTLCPKSDADALAAGLAKLLQRRPADRVVFILREEFSRHLDGLTPLSPFLAVHARFSMREWPVGFQDLKACVEQPAARFNLQFQTGLVDDLVRGVLQRDSALLLLQFALRQLWAKRDRNRITWEAYRAIGGDPVGIVEQFADRASQAVAGGFPEDRQGAAREAMLEVWADLVGVDHLFNAYRLSLPWHELVGGSKVELRQQVLRAMEREGLLLRHGADDDPQATLEIHDEALLQYWSDGQDVVARKRDSARRRVSLTEAAQRWERAGRPIRRGLLTTWQLHELQELPDPTPLEQAYLERSRRVLRRAGRLRRAAYVGAGVVVTALLGLGMLAHLKRSDADRMELSRQIGTAAAALHEGHLGSGLDQVIRASARALQYPAEDSLQFEARAALATVHRKTDDVQRLFFDRAAVFRAVAFQAGDSKARLLAYGGTDGRVHLARLDQPLSQPSLEACQEAAVTGIAFDPSGTRLAAACADGQVSLWSVADGSRLGPPVRLSHMLLWAVAFGRDGTWLAAAGLDNTVYAMPVPASGTTPPGPPLKLTGPETDGPKDGIWSIAFHPADDSLLVGDGRGRLLRCDPRQAEKDACRDTKFYAASQTDSIRAIVFSPTGRRVAIGHWKGSVELWDAALNPANRRSIDVSHTPGPVLSLAFHGHCHLAVGKALGLHYRVVGVEWEGPPSASECSDLLQSSVGDEVLALVSDPASGRMAAATRGGYVAVLDPSRNYSRLRSAVPVNSPPDQQVRGTVLATSDRDTLLGVALQREPEGSAMEPIRVLRTAEGPQIVPGAPIPLVSGGIQRLSASRSGGRLAALSYDGATEGSPKRVTVWPLRAPAYEGESVRVGSPTLSLTQVEHFRGYPPSRVALSPDGAWLVAAFPARQGQEHLTPRDQGMALWALVNVDTGVVNWIPSGLASVREVAFSADGRHLAAGGDTLAGGDRDEVRLWEVSRSGVVRLERPLMQVSAFAQRVQELVFAEDVAPSWPARVWRRHGAPLVLAGGENGEVDVWSVDTGQPKTPYWLATTHVWLLAHEPLTDMLAASDSRHVLRLWDTRAPGFDAVVLSSSAESYDLPGWLAFGTQGRWLVSAARRGSQGEVHLWDLDVSSLRRKACAMVRKPGEHGAPFTSADEPCAGLVP